MTAITVPDCWNTTLDAVHARIAPRFVRAEVRTRPAPLLPCQSQRGRPPGADRRGIAIR